LPDYGTNFYLTIAKSADGLTVVVTLVNTKTNNINYLLLVATNLDGPWVTNQSLVATSTVTLAAPIWTYGFESVFFLAKEGPAPAPGTVKWMRFIGTNGNDAWGQGLDSSPAVSSATGQILVTIANCSVPSCELFAVDPLFGEVQWVDNIFTNYDTSVVYQAGELTGSAAVATNGTIYVGSLDGHLYSINPDGSTNWVRPAGYHNSIYSTPSIGNNGAIYVGSDEAEEGHDGSPVTGVTSFNPTNGYTNWFFVPQDLYYGNGGDVDSDVSIGADSKLYFLAEGSRLYCLSSNGLLNWFLTLPGDTEPDSTPAIQDNGTIVVGSGNVEPNVVNSPYLYFINPDGSLNYVANVTPYFGGPMVQTSPTVDLNGVTYTGSGNNADYTYGSLLAFSTNGALLWGYEDGLEGAYIGGFIVTSPAIAADGTVYAGDYSGIVYAVNNGTLLWDNVLGGSIVGSPAILPDGSVLVTSTDGYLYCLWGNDGPLQESLNPMFGQNPSHTGQQPPIGYSNSIPYNGAPFLFNAFYYLSQFSFSMTGVPGSSKLERLRLDQPRHNQLEPAGLQSGHERHHRERHVPRQLWQRVQQILRREPKQQHVADHRLLPPDGRPRHQPAGRPVVSGG